MTLLVPEFDKDIGQRQYSEYGFKSTWAAFRSHLIDCMEYVGYVCKSVDPNLWM